ncbi:hypothetical protein HanOQP8_Chr08g0293461 [Helianthus annuus]|nr:hypothetical protein HanIR_Chr08g0374951 [Helianthus annuus]KAJ0719815.1 hypothetical protein HanLR1_Chr08g0285961 [Helianthus annuus]KAJ0723040.1 hypothetical protein HanOQP8_Chr08g0293461 [Helianthus annuus]
MADHDGEGESIEFTPTWVVATVCTVMVGVSLALERLLHFAGKLMLLGFVSLLLSVCQSRIVKICVNEDTTKHFLPCSLDAKENHHTLRELLENKHSSTGYCALKNKVPLLSLEAVHHLHMFIFVLAIVHVTFSVLIVVFGGAKISQWKQWEASTKEDNLDTSKGNPILHFVGSTAS